MSEGWRYYARADGRVIRIHSNQRTALPRGWWNVRGSKHRRAAERFIEYVGSVDAQILTAERVWRLPARHDLPADRVPAWVADVDRRMVTAPMDWPLLAREGANWMRYWDQRVRGTGKGAP